MSGGVLLGVGGGAIFSALLILFVLLRPASREERVGADRLVVPALPVPTGGKSTVRAKAPKEATRTRLAAAADGALERSGRREALAAALDIADLSLRTGEFLVVLVAIAAALGLVSMMLGGPVAALAAVVVTAVGAKLYVAVRISKRRAAFEEQLPDVLQLLVSSLRAGYGLPQALNAVANQVSEPSRKELQRVLLEARVGREPSDALRAVADRMGSRDFEWVVDAVQINQEVGGELAQVLENVAETVRERHRMRRQVNTLTAEGRMSAYVLTALPFVLVGAMTLTNPGYFEPMIGPIGLFLGIASVVLMSIGWVWMRRVIKAQL